MSKKRTNHIKVSRCNSTGSVLAVNTITNRFAYLDDYEESMHFLTKTASLGAPLDLVSYKVAMRYVRGGNNHTPIVMG